MDRKEIDTVFKENQYKKADADYQLIRWLEDEEKVGLPENLKSVFISANEDELYFVFDCKDKEIQAIEDSSKDFDNMISVFVNFGNYENTKKFRYNIFQILLIGRNWMTKFAKNLKNPPMQRGRYFFAQKVCRLMMKTYSCCRSGSIISMSLEYSSRKVCRNLKAFLISL